MKQHPSPSTTGIYCGATTSMFISPSILASAEELARKAAELNGLIAPQTATHLAQLIEAADGPLTQVWDATEHGSDQKNLRPDPAIDPRRRIVAVLGHYDQLLISESMGHSAAWVYVKHSFEQLGLHPRLWRLPRAISRWNQLQVGETELMEFKLMTCIKEVDHILDVFNRKNLRQRVLHSFSSSKLIRDAGVGTRTGPAVLNLLILGSQPSSEFESFTGLPIGVSEKELARLKGLGLVIDSSSNAAWIEPGLPAWFAEGSLDI
ncbi:hypothetical protein F3J44_24265 [Pantoea sp. Tr-811]|uniref:hypothetical protein n=1 Tax=Pantoea sp. Tr-811 TaxID=2608361 RepID=UPI00142414AE|nr:hypothetical protein [Pantoea sp. Tr-811]NIF29468.1 hypothetical protein [Pantoea sp. Tr-811]